MQLTEDKLVLAQKQGRLEECLKNFTSLGIAFSGGVDSTCLLAAALRALGHPHVVALTAVSQIHPAGEKEAAIEAARLLGVRHILFNTHELDDPLFRANPPNRCYHCKKNLFRSMRAEAQRLGLQALAHGANRDDLADFRPGFKAAEEMGIAAPLIEADLSKADVRGLAKGMGLNNWDRPAMACLATRIPYGTALQEPDLNRIDKAEAFLRSMGALQCRVRQHGKVALIETDAPAIERFARPGARGRIAARLRELGYAHVALDLEGYTAGKMNRDRELDPPR